MKERQQPLFQLAMICKNSSETIVQTLSSYKSIISYWTIIDTGSTDGTQDLIKQTLADIPGQLHEYPFEGFTKSRNRCLDLIGQHAQYTIMPDDSYFLSDPEALERELANTNYPVVSIRIHFQGNIANQNYTSKRISLSDSGIRYFGSIHEDLNRGINYEIKSCYMLDLPGQTLQQDRTQTRLRSDLALLAGKNDPRSLYYMAMTHIKLNEHDQAKHYLLQRLESNDKDYEERFQSMIHLAVLTKDTNWYYRAIQEFPTRQAEAWFNLYLHTGHLQCLSNAYLHRKADLTRCRLPVITDIYHSYIAGYMNTELKDHNVSLYVIVPLFNLRTASTIKQARLCIESLNKIPYVKPVVVMDANYFPGNDLPAICLTKNQPQRCLWLKENLVNLAIRTLINEYQAAYFCWLDADVVIEDPNFGIETLARLIDYIPIILQPWSKVRTGQNIEESWSTSRPYGHTGHCWALNKQAFNRLGGLYDKLVTGSFDYYLAHRSKVFLRTYPMMPDFIRRDLAEYDTKLDKVDFAECVPDIEISHRPIGSIKNRMYEKRHHMISGLQETDLRYDSEGLLEISSNYQKIDELRNFYARRSK